MNIIRTFMLVAVTGSLLLNGCSMKEEKATNLAIDLANMDQKVSPGEDFYHFANGNWIKNNPLPAEYVQYGAFTEVYERNREQLKELVLKAAGAGAAKGTIEQKIGDFYHSGMDSALIEELNVGVLKADLDMIDAISNTDDLIKVVAQMQMQGTSPLFYIFASPDQENSEYVIAFLYQGGVGLPDVEYYTNDDERSKEIREEYLKHVARMFRLAGIGETPEADAASVMEMETQLAKASMTLLERRNPHATYNRRNLASLGEEMPNFNWELYFNTIGLGDPGDLNLGMPEFFGEINSMLATVSLDDWKSYLKWTLLNRSANFMNDEIERADFDFYNAFLSGQQEMKPRWKRVLSVTSGSLGEAIGQLYVKEYFPPEAKERMEEMVANLKSALSVRIDRLDWMSEATKEQAHAKLEAMRVKVGYPDKWTDYSTLEIVPGRYLENIRNARIFEFNRDMDKVGKPVDKEEWVMSPQTVNAGYVPSMNEIIFPAGILAPPFFFLDADDPVNYGAIGMVIGHEMTHGFDDKGRLFDKQGNLADWWQEEDSKKFIERSQVLVDQYNAYPILDSLRVDGELTLGENIADLGGLNIAWDALMKSMEGKEQAEIDGLSPEQRFFLAYAQVWRQNITEKELMRRLKEDVHSPGIARVNGPLVHMAQFYEAFGITDKDPVYIPEEERASIW